MKKLKSLLLFFVCGLVACAMALPLVACNGDGGEGGGGEGSGAGSGTQKGQKVLTSLSVDSFDAKVDFAIGEEFSYEGLEVTANYQVLGESITTETEDVTQKVDFDTSEFDNTKSGTYTVYLSYTYGAVTLFGDYEVEVASNLEGTIAGLEVTYGGARQIALSKEAPTATVDLTKIKVTRMTGETVDDVGETILTKDYYTLSYSKDGGALTDIEEDTQSLTGLTKGVYSIYAVSSYSRGGETFEMNGFVTVFVTDPVVSIAKDEGGKTEFEYKTTEDIGADWTYTATYGSGATAKLTAEDVELEGIVTDNEGANTATASYTENVLGYDAEANDAVETAYTVSCEVTYTIGENPNAGQQVTDTYSVNFSDASKGWALGEGTIPDTLIGSDGSKDGNGGIISLLSSKSDGSAQAKTKVKSATAADGTGFTNAIQIGTISSTKAWKIDLTSYDESAEVVISVYASTSGATRAIGLYQEASSSAVPLFTSVELTDSSVAYLSEWTVTGGGTYYIGSTKDAINFFAIDVAVTHISGGADTPAQPQTFIADFADASKGWSGVKDEKITSTLYVAADGTVSDTKTDGVLALYIDPSVADAKTKYSSKTATDEAGNEYKITVQFGAMGKGAAWQIDLSEYSAQTNAKITIYASTSGSDARQIALYSAADADAGAYLEGYISESLATNSTAYTTEWTVAGGSTYYVASTASSINYFKIVIEVGV